MSVSTALCKKLMPDMMKRLFYITTLFTFMVRRSHRHVNYTRLFGVCLDWTPTDETFNLPALFTEHIWGETSLADKVSEETIKGNLISLDDTSKARLTQFYYHYGEILKYYTYY